MYVPLYQISGKTKRMDYKIKEEEKGTCLECGKEFYGRSDKKFCSTACKNHYHNRTSDDKRLMKQRIFTDLSANYAILEKLLNMGLKVINLCDAEAIGFRSSIITGYSKTKGHNEFRCFDIRYCQSPTRIFNIRRVELERTKRVCRSPLPQSSCKCR